MHDLPSRFNEDVVKNCNFTVPGTNKFPLCKYAENSGYGPQIENSSRILSNKSWLATNQFLLEVIFHNRMKTYECLTNDSSIASAIFVPYYLCLDIMPYLWGNFDLSMKDSPGLNLLKWVAERPEWKRMWGRDHFLIGGRIATDFRREIDRRGAWGRKFRFFPESNNITMLSIEASPWNNDLAIPYPTSFHPSEDSEVVEWQDRMRRQERPYLFSFSGAPRPSMKTSIRSILIDQCQASSSTCKLLDCREGVTNCGNSIHVMKLYQSSIFCLQPPGDSLTRRSAFESILSGCIPVFFHPGSAYMQYTWHLTKNYTKYSVFIPEKNLWVREFRVNKTLIKFSKEEVAAMREEVIRLIPGIIYSDPRRVRKDESLGDAFDLAVKGILERIEKFRSVRLRYPLMLK
ncbi:hypothetical protein Pint_25531 [Pistacia integerrima]|uniref:Uncharacterized protein n=1 Tax=Pistacia integerrima TaxID=434235 RepID=A0ACC0YD21_9ROSI|nr:hypothetical protein Pint_25531 [Pistacia integerrima]